MSKRSSKGQRAEWVTGEWKDTTWRWQRRYAVIAAVLLVVATTAAPIVLDIWLEGRPDSQRVWFLVGAAVVTVVALFLAWWATFRGSVLANIDSVVYVSIAQLGETGWYLDNLPRQKMKRFESIRRVYSPRLSEGTIVDLRGQLESASAALEEAQARAHGASLTIVPGGHFPAAFALGARAVVFPESEITEYAKAHKLGGAGAGGKSDRVRQAVFSIGGAELSCGTEATAGLEGPLAYSAAPSPSESGGEVVSLRIGIANEDNVPQWLCEEPVTFILGALDGGGRLSSIQVRSGADHDKSAVSPLGAAKAVAFAITKALHDSPTAAVEVRARVPRAVAFAAGALFMARPKWRDGNREIRLAMQDLSRLRLFAPTYQTDENGHDVPGPMREHRVF